jgi:hypothetical protein
VEGQHLVPALSPQVVPQLQWTLWGKYRGKQGESGRSSGVSNGVSNGILTGFGLDSRVPAPNLPLPHDAGDDTVRTIVLGPSITKAWAGGSVDGLRVCAGGVVHFEWDDEGIVTRATFEGSKTEVRLVNKDGRALVG